MTKKPVKGRAAGYKQRWRRMNEPEPTSESEPDIVIRLSGEYDISRQDELDRELAPAYDCRVAVLDMTGVSYMDSTGLALLINLKKRMTVRSGGVLRIAAPQANVRRVLELTRLDEIFEVYDSLDEALEG